MTGKQDDYKLDNVRVIGNQTEETKNSNKYHALKTSRVFKALKEVFNIRK